MGGAPTAQAVGFVTKRLQIEKLNTFGKKLTKLGGRVRPNFTLRMTMMRKQHDKQAQLPHQRVINGDRFVNVVSKTRFAGTHCNHSCGGIEMQVSKLESKGLTCPQITMKTKCNKKSTSNFFSLDQPTDKSTDYLS